MVMRTTYNPEDSDGNANLEVKTSARAAAAGIGLFPPAVTQINQRQSILKLLEMREQKCAQKQLPELVGRAEACLDKLFQYAKDKMSSPTFPELLQPYRQRYGLTKEAARMTQQAPSDIQIIDDFKMLLDNLASNNQATRFADFCGTCRLELISFLTNASRKVEELTCSADAFTLFPFNIEDHSNFNLRVTLTAQSLSHEGRLRIIEVLELFPDETVKQILNYCPRNLTQTFEHSAKNSIAMYLQNNESGNENFKALANRFPELFEYPYAANGNANNQGHARRHRQSMLAHDEQGTGYNCETIVRSCKLL